MNSTLPFAAPITVGSHLLSRESINKNTASWPSMSFSNFSTSALAWAIELALGGTGWPGIGIERVWPVAFCENNSSLYSMGLNIVCATHNPREDFLQTGCSAFCFGLAAIKAVDEFKEWLPNRI